MSKTTGWKHMGSVTVDSDKTREEKASYRRKLFKDTMFLHEMKPNKPKLNHKKEESDSSEE